MHNSTQSWAQNQAEKILVVKTIHNQNFDLSALKNKVVIVVFWADWCSVCRAEITQLDNLYKKYHQQGLEIIGLNVDGVTKNAQNLSYPIAIFDNAAINNFDNPKTLPMIYIINKDGSNYSQLYLPEQIAINNVEKIIKSLLTRAP
ncbi:MAG: TlpA disulfide reductase family protein [Pseudomonadota bacterium]